MPQAPRTGGGVKIADDGFWLSLDDVAAGSRVHYKFQPQGGMETNDNVIYSPSPQGQFIYTGVKPVSARVTGVDAPGNNPLSGSSTMRSSGPGARGVGFGTGYVMGSTHHHDQHSSSSHQFTDNDPPRNPAAY